MRDKDQLIKDTSAVIRKIDPKAAACFDAYLRIKDSKIRRTIRKLILDVAASQ